MGESTKIFRSIKNALWGILYLMLVILIISLSIFGLFVYETIDNKSKSETTNVIVAKVDIKSGDEITADKIGMKRLPDSSVPKHTMCPHMVDFVIGHKATRDFKIGEPLDYTKLNTYIARKIEVHPDDKK